MIVRFDLNDEESIKQAFAKVEAQWGRLDVLVNNAVQWMGNGDPNSDNHFESQPADRWRTKLRSGLEGTFYTIQQVLPLMRRRAWGRIINISSNLAEDGLSGAGAYTGLPWLGGQLSSEWGKHTCNRRYLAFQEPQ